MKIIYLHQYFNTPNMSGSTRSYEMARRLVARGHEVHMITTERSEMQQTTWYTTNEDGIIVHWLPLHYSNHLSYSERMRAFFQFALKAATRATSISGDVVFATSTPLTIALPAVYAARSKRIPMVLEVRDLWPELPIAMGALSGTIPIKLAKCLEKFAYKNASAIVVLSPGMRDGILHFGYPADYIQIIPNSCDIELFQTADSHSFSFRSQHNWLGKRPLILYAGTLGRVNGVEYLVDIAKIMQDIAPDVRFLTVGDGHEFTEIHSYAKRLGILERSFFMMGNIKKSEIPMIFAAADITMSLVIDLPQLWANSANKFFDSLAAGKPIAINYGGWQKDILEESGAGIVIPARDPKLAAEMLCKFVHDVTRLQAASKAASHLAKERFDRDLMASKLERLLIQIVEEGRLRHDYYHKSLHPDGK